MSQNASETTSTFLTTKQRWIISNTTTFTSPLTSERHKSDSEMWPDTWPYLFLLTFIFLVVIANFCVIGITIYRRCLHYTTCYILASLALVNILNGAFVMPISLANRVNGKNFFTSWKDVYHKKIVLIQII